MLLASLMAADAYVAEAMSVVSGEDFYREGHRAVYRAIESLFGGGEPVEPITVIERLTKDGQLDAAGGRVAVLDLMETPFIAASFRTYAQMVRDAAIQRRLLQVGQQIEKMVAQREGETTAMLQDAETLVYGLSQKDVRGDFARAHELVIRGIERLTAAEESGTGLTGVGTGFVDLDRIVGGLQPGNVIVVAARPSMGKTALALGIAEHAALSQERSVAIFSLEMSGDELIQRLLASTAIVDAGRIRAGRLAPEDWSRIGRAADRLSAARLFIDDSEGVSIGEMRSKTRRLKSRDGLDLVIVDYIQLMEGTDRRRDENRVQELFDDLARPQDAGPRPRGADHLRLPAQPGAGRAHGQAPDALGPARVGRHRAGRRPGADDLPRRLLRRRTPRPAASPRSTWPRTATAPPRR